MYKYILFIAVFFAITNTVHAEEVFYDKTTAISPAQIVGSAMTDLRGIQTTWDYGGFRYSSSSTFTIDTITWQAYSWEGTTTARWKVYEVVGTATSSTGNLIAISNSIEVNSNAVIQAQNIFTEPLELLWSKDYQFILDTEIGERVMAYSWIKTGEYPTYTFSTYCSDTSDIYDCLWGDIPFSGAYTGYGWPSVKLSRETLGNDEYVITFSPCSTDTRTHNECHYSTDFSEFMTYDASINTTQENRKLEILIKNTKGDVLDSVAYLYTDAGYYDINTQFAMVHGSTTAEVYLIQSCLSAFDEYAVFATRGTSCTTMVYGNGTTTQSYLDWWASRYGSTSSGLSAFQELACSDLSILDVAKGVKCALLWAFEPSPASLEKFSTSLYLIKNAYPIGYVTHIVSDINETMEATSTELFTREIELGKYFGKPNTATTTISLAGKDIYIEKIEPVTEKIEIFLWILFSGFFLSWALTRTL